MPGEVRSGGLHRRQCNIISNWRNGQVFFHYDFLDRRENSFYTRQEKPNAADATGIHNTTIFTASQAQVYKAPARYAKRPHVHAASLLALLFIKRLLHCLHLQHHAGPAGMYVGVKTHLHQVVAGVYRIFGQRRAAVGIYINFLHPVIFSGIQAL